MWYGLRKEIVFIPLGSVWRTQLYREELIKAASIYEREARIINLSLPIKERAYNPRRRQFNALTLLDQICKLYLDADRTLRIGVTAADIYVPGRNFIFGIADSSKGCAVMSVARLTYAQYDASSELLKERVLKTASHELGHLFGLYHCANSECLMSPSNTIAEVDRKKTTICDKCRSMLELDQLK